MQISVRRRAAVFGTLALVAAAGAVTAAVDAAAAAGPTVTVGPRAGLVTGDTVTISGAGFSTSGPGIYVGVASRAKYSASDPSAFSAVKWVHVGATPSSGQDVLNADGSFSTTLSVAATFGSGATATDCRVEQCAVFTLAAHGSSDRSQDTSVDLGFFAPSITVSDSSDLPESGSVTVSGSGYHPGKGVYVAQTVARPDSGAPSVYGNAAWVRSVGDDGTFSQAVTASATFTPRGGSPVDCRAVQCYLATFDDHTDQANRDQDVFTPISFAAIAPSSSPAPSSAPSSASSSATPTQPAVTVSPSSGLAAAGATVTVSGSGFSTSGPGIYVGVASRAKYSASDPSAFSAVKWVHVGATPSSGQDVLNADGSFSTTLPVPATFGSGTTATDCREEQCAVFTLAAHGSSDRSQDTATDITFAGAPDPGTPTVTPSSSAAPSGSGSAAPGTVAPGGSVTVTADGFTPGEQVSAVLHSDPVALGVQAADVAGRYSLTFTVPAGLAAGAHTVTLTGLSSGLVVTVPLTVVAASATATATGVSETGADVASAVALAVLLAAGGVTLLVVGRRRSATHR